MNSIVRIGTRGSALAMWQAERVSSLLAGRRCRTEIITIKTSGDKITNRSLTDLGGKGLFVKEIQEALLGDDIDIAVHSLKDYPAENPPGLVLSCIPEREDPRDVLIKSARYGDGDLRDDAVVGTGSLRRKFQLRLLKPGWKIMAMRGNVDTRLRKMDNGFCDGIVLAAAGLKRLGKEEVISSFLSVSEMIPAAGQGAIAIESKQDRRDISETLKPLEDHKARIEIDVERKFLRDLQGSCTTPVGIHASVEGDRIKLCAFLSSLSGDKWIRDGIEGDVKESMALADALFERFLDLGARKLLSSV